jgi:hypothetical protein
VSRGEGELLTVPKPCAVSLLSAYLVALLSEKSVHDDQSHRAAKIGKATAETARALTNPASLPRY